MSALVTARERFADDDLRHAVARLTIRVRLVEHAAADDVDPHRAEVVQRDEDDLMQVGNGARRRQFFFPPIGDRNPHRW